MEHNWNQRTIKHEGETRLRGEKQTQRQERDSYIQLQHNSRNTKTIVLNFFAQIIQVLADQLM